MRTAVALSLTLLGVSGAISTLEAQSGPVVIYYGLNESHSRDWVQLSDDGVVGVTYFQRFDGGDDEGTLIYKAIHPDGSESSDSVATGTRLEKSVLLFDSMSGPHIFVAASNNSDQTIDHYQRDVGGNWQCETIVHFYNQGGKFIYELSADTGPDGSFHLLVLKTRSDVDSNDYWDAWINACLYHLTNATGTWERELVHNYDTAYTYDHQIKSSSRQDIDVDSDGYVHVIFGEQINGNNLPDPSRLRYATNETGSWVFETALNYDSGTRDEAGWMASLCLDNNNKPYVTGMYKKRVSTGSAVYCRLLVAGRLSADNWPAEVIASSDDGYYATDGRTYTGGLSHLVFDRDNTPHVVFSDIASSHWGENGTNRLNIGNIRHGVLEDGVWNITTIYRQPLPTSFLNATEMHGMCLTISEDTGAMRVVGQELEITGDNQYTSSLVDFVWDIVAPAEPTEFAGQTVAGGLRLTWAHNADGDLSHYALYRGTTEEFTPDSINRIAETSDTSVVDSTWSQEGGHHYKLSAVDILGNESDHVLLRPTDIVVPTWLQAFSTTVEGRGIKISWSLYEVGEVDFKILRREGADPAYRELPSSEISRRHLSYSFVDDGCKPGSSYYYRVVAQEGNEQWMLFETNAVSIPIHPFALDLKNYPNPFNPTTTVSFTLSEKLRTHLAIYDVSGQLVSVLINGELNAGSNQITWDGTDSNGNRVSSGVYFCRLRAGKSVATRIMALLK